MGANVVPGYNTVLTAADEVTLGTPVAPASVAAFALQAISTISADLGDAQSPVVRGKQDRGLGRGMQDGFVSGRYPPVPWSVSTSMKTRSAVDAVPRELQLWKAAGLVKTVNAGVSYVISPGITPIESADFVPQTLRRILGRSPGEMEMEVLAGCLCDTVKMEGGDKELSLTFSGFGQNKQTATGSTITFASGVDTAITVTAAETYKYAVGCYYICGSEIVLCTAVVYGSTTVTFARAQLASSGVAHAAVAIYPYVPAGIVYAGTPISEALTTTCTFGGTAFRVLKWTADIKTGLAPLPGETGSAYFQGVKATRYDASLSMDFLLKGDDVAKFNMAVARTALAVSLVQGTAVGGVVTLAFPYAELVAPTVKDNANDSVIVSASLRIRDDVAGSNAFSITLT